MSADRRPTKNLEDQLRSFGAALQHAVAEEITPHHGYAADPGSPLNRRWPLPVGVAATLIALIAGFAWLSTRDQRAAPATEPTVTVASSAPADPTPASTIVTTDPGPTQPPTTVPAAVPLADAVGPDALGLVAGGEWKLEERREEPLRWEASEQDECLGIRQDQSIAGRPTIYERYSTTGATFVDLDVTYIDAGTDENAAMITSIFDRLGACGSDPASGPLPSVPAAAQQGVELHGYRIGDTFAVIALRRAGNLVITVELEDQGVTDDLIADLVQRSAALLTSHSSVVEPISPVPSSTLPLGSPIADRPVTAARLGNGDIVVISNDGTQTLLYNGVDDDQPPGEAVLADSVAVMADGRAYVSTCCETPAGTFFEVGVDEPTLLAGHGLDVSPAGTRLASVGSHELTVRDADGQPIASATTAADTADPYAVMWIDDERLGVLWRPAGVVETRLSVVTTETLDTFDDAGVVVPYDGSDVEGAPQQPMSFAGASTTGAILVLDGDVSDLLLAYDPATLERRPDDDISLAGVGIGAAVSAWVEQGVLSWVGIDDVLIVDGEEMPSAVANPGEFRWVRRFS